MTDPSYRDLPFAWVFYLREIRLVQNTVKLVRRNFIVASLGFHTKNLRLRVPLLFSGRALFIPRRVFPICKEVELTHQLKFFVKPAVKGYPEFVSRES